MENKDTLKKNIAKLSNAELYEYREWVNKYYYFFLRRIPRVKMVHGKREVITHRQKVPTLVHLAFRAAYYLLSWLDREFEYRATSSSEGSDVPLKNQPASSSLKRHAALTDTDSD